MVNEPKPSWSISLFKSRVFRFVVLISVIFSSLPLPKIVFAAPSPAPVDLLSSPNSEAALFIIGPQSPITNSWFDTTEIQRARVHGEACPDTPPTDPEALNSFVLLQYYDLPLTEYITYYRTKDPAFLAYAQKCADVWWKHPTWIQQGAQRGFMDGLGPPPRHAGVGGLILRALDGRPEMWDWINQYTRTALDLWLKQRINNSQLYYGVREGAFALHYATWLAKVLPDSFPLQAGGTATNGATLRGQYLADIEAISINYFGRLQLADGSWRWDDWDFVDTDGGTLKGIMQPFMVGMLLNALIEVHRLSTNTTVKANIQNQITKACLHLYRDGPYRKDESVVGLTGKRWRSFWYFYHGGTTVNPTRYENGGGSYITADQTWYVKSERQLIATVFSAYGYAYLLTGDPIYKTMGDDLFEAAFGDQIDGIKDEADGTAKNYNQNYRMGGRYLVWRGDGPISSPSPTPTPSSTPTPTPTPTPKPTPPLSSSAAFVQLDTTTKGSWKNVYGGDGYNTVNDTIKYPSWANVNVTGYSSPTWSSSTTDARALQKTTGSDRIAARWESNSFFTIDMNLTDGQTHRVALYGLDWDGNNRSQRVDVLDWATNTLLDSRTISSFNGGQYLVWDVRGRVKIIVNKSGAKTAVLSGIYFGGATPTTAPTPTPTPTPVSGAPQVTLTVPTTGSIFVAGQDITLAASASDANGQIAKVEFYSNGTLIATDTTSPYTALWANAPKGNYDLTAKATDNSGLTATSAVVSITVANSPNSVSRAKGRAGSLVQQDYAGAAEGIATVTSTALASDIDLLTADIEQAYSEFQAESESFGTTAATTIDSQIRAAILFSKASAGLALRTSTPNIKNNLLRIASHLAIAEDLMRYNTITRATSDQASATKTRTNIVVGQANAGYSLTSISPVAPSSLGAITGVGNLQPMLAQTVFGFLQSDGTLPYEVGGLSVTVDGMAVPVLYASPWSIKFFMPADIPLGTAEVIISSQDGYICQGVVSVERTGTRIMTTNDDDGGVAVVSNVQNAMTSNFEVTTPYNFSSDKRTRLTIFATGISANAQNTNTGNDINVSGSVRANYAESIAVQAQLSNGQVYTLPVEFAGVQGVLPGLDQINVILIPELKGAGAVQLTVVLGGQRSNAPTVFIK